MVLGICVNWICSTVRPHPVFNSQDCEKDLIISGGYDVHPKEVEEIIKIIEKNQCLIQFLFMNMVAQRF